MSFKRAMRYLIPLLAIVVYHTPSFSQKAAVETDYVQLIAAGDYRTALKNITSKIEEINSSRVADKRVPSDFITLGGTENEGLSRIKQLNKMFRERKVSPFFIEDNPELYVLHKAAAKCCFELNQLDDSLNHYYQCLRFHQPKPDEDDVLFWELAQVYNKKKNTGAYCDALINAYEINPHKFEYSLELGRALYRSKQNKLAIFHLTRYYQSRGDEMKESDVLIKLAGLNEGINRYLESQKYYQAYLLIKPNDGYIHFALGDIAYHNIGNYKLAVDELRKSLKLLPDSEIYRKAKAYEYIGDMFFNTLKFDPAIDAYKETMKYQDLIMLEIKKNDEAIGKIDAEIRSLKTSLLKEKNYVQYNEYQFQLQEKERLLSERKEKKYEYEKIDPGRCRWNIGESLEKTDRLNDALEYYRQVIIFNYRANEAREKMVKLQLKIKRGY